ncbi:MAG: tetratricopeptide repeat protein [Deltaproteobacteria bacterium]|jgi:tetratricopeptide (TPR) repeat protein|nr:tetratricopeptide repeat protein [Deltaproteobacteria bacterium]
MGNLSVTVRLNGVQVDDRVVRVDRLTRLGEAEDAAVAFPGADLKVVRVGARLNVRGRSLEEGDEARISLGPVEVHLEHTVTARLPSEWSNVVDPRFVATLLVVVAGAAYHDASLSWWQEQGGSAGPVGERLARLLRGPSEGVGPRRAASLQSTELPTAGLPALELFAVDGPRHSPDDRPGGIGWSRWYRSAVPADSARVLAALDRLAADEADPVARRIIANAAYNHDNYDQAIDHYSWIVQRWPSDRDALLRLAQAWQRTGRHRAEITAYRQILRMEPQSVPALAGLAVAHARMNQLDACAHALEELVAVAPDSPTTALAQAKVDALQGRDDEALDHLERALAGRAGLSAEAQVDLRRDLALDPAFAAARADRRLLSLLHRQLGAAAPRPVRR